MSEQNLYRTENYQNYVKSLHRHENRKLEKSISDVQGKSNDCEGDNDSLNSVAESLNNYLDVKVRRKRIFSELWEYSEIV